MSSQRTFPLTLVMAALIAALGCGTLTPLLQTPSSPPTPIPTVTPIALPPIPVQPGAANPNEPVLISGNIPFTSPFFLSSTAEPYVLLEDEAGFVQRNLEFEFPVSGQVIGPVEMAGDNYLTYTLSLPSIPRGTYVDVDNNGQSDTGVQVFAVAYWSNTWGDPFLERRDGTGWSTAYTSAITDPDRDYEIVGGTLVVWSPDDRQGFPTGFGADGLLFTADDPTAPIPAGYNLVDLNQEPFRIYKEAQPRIDLFEGAGAVTDLSDMSYSEAFEALFEKASREYPFTVEKGIDWNALYQEFAPRVASARNSADFYRALRDFSWAIPDGHVGISPDANVFFEEQGGSFGLILSELSDGRVLATSVLPGLPADEAGIQVGAEIIAWGGKPISQAISEVQPYFGPYSTDHARRLAQVIFLTRVPPDTRVTVKFRNPGTASPTEVTMRAVIDYDSLFQAIPLFNTPLVPIETRMLEDTGLFYIKINTFMDDDRLMAHMWDHIINSLIDNDIAGLILDIRTNGGGNGALAMNFAGYFYDREFILSQDAYYNQISGLFEYEELPTRVTPAPVTYSGPIAVLIGPDCISACEWFAYAMTHNGRSTLVGHYPTAGAAGEVGRGQYDLPEGLSMQFPTGRPETPDGQLLIEGVGVQPDIVVPVSEDSALGRVDAVLNAAIEALLGG
jgi:C-terminal processing protease CtpA/Prc